MPQSGQEMLDETINTCKEIAEGLENQDSDWHLSIVEIVEKFEEVSETFFFKTMPSIPPTRTAMREASSLLELKRSNDWDAFSSSLVILISNAQNVIEKAGMKGTTLT
jgi:hypothetical protein